MRSWYRTIPEERIKVLQVVVPITTAFIDELREEQAISLMGQELAKKLFEHRKVLVAKTEKKTANTVEYYSCFIEVIIPKEAPL